MGTNEWIWVAVVVFGLLNLLGFVALWTKVSVVLNTFEMRIEQLEKDRQEVRFDVKELTNEVHNLVVELARQSAPQHRQQNHHQNEQH